MSECKYCLEDAKLRKVIQQTVYQYSTVNTDAKTLVINDCSASFDPVHINNCPMCGRKL